MKWRKWKLSLRAIPRNGIRIGNPNHNHDQLETIFTYLYFILVFVFYLCVRNKSIIIMIIIIICMHSKNNKLTNNLDLWITVKFNGCRVADHSKPRNDRPADRWGSSLTADDPS